MRRACSLALVALLGLAACTRPSPAVMCHNANCAGLDVSRDDTPQALSASLALTYDGRPVVDGIEWDTFWYGAESRCIFAHDLNNDTSTEVTEAAQIIRDYLAVPDAPSWNGERFTTFIELKGFVGTSFDDRHTPEQFIQHSQCAIQAAEIIADGARAGGHPLTVGFVAGVPEHLTTLSQQLPASALASDPNVKLMLIGDIFAPYSDLVPELSDYKVPLDGVEYHPDYMTEQQREAYRSLGIELVQWSFLTTSEALDAIEYWEPEFAITSEALLLRRWIED